jgi:hypothetical protein
VLNLTNEKLRRKQVLRMRKSNKTRKTAIRLKKEVFTGNHLIEQGWTPKEVTALKRYLKLAYELRTIERSYKQALEHMSKDLFPEVLEKAKTFTDNSILLNDELLLNVIEKGRTSASADELSAKLKERFGNFLMKYVFKLDKVIDGIKKENFFNFTQFDIDKLESGDPRLQEGVLDSVSDLIKNTFNKFKGWLSSLFEDRDELEVIMEKMNSMESLYEDADVCAAKTEKGKETTGKPVFKKQGGTCEITDCAENGYVPNRKTNRCVHHVDESVQMLESYTTIYNK